VVSELAEPKVPFPEVVHKTLAWFVAVPAKVWVLPSQIEASLPAFAVGVFWMERILASVAETVQGEVAEAVKVKVTVPAAISIVPGEYTVVGELAEPNVPFPEVVHKTLAWFVAAPAKV
jgi:hypothetical protein